MFSRMYFNGHYDMIAFKFHHKKSIELLLYLLFNCLSVVLKRVRLTTLGWIRTLYSNITTCESSETNN